MNAFAVRVTLQAQAEIDLATQYIALDSIANALAWEERVTHAIASLAKSRGYAFDEAATHRNGFEVRRYVFDRTYLIFYRVDESANLVEVFDFRHGARQL